MRYTSPPAFAPTAPFIPKRPLRLSPNVTSARPPTPRTSAPVMQMVRVSVPLTIEAPNQFCYSLFSDLSKMPEWSSTLEAVERDAQDPLFSDWKFSWNGIRLKWRAKDVESDQHHDDIPAVSWRSVSGLVHTGLVQFEHLEQDKSTNMIMTVHYDIDSLLAVIMQSSLVSSFVQSAIENDLTKFRSYALRNYRRAKRSGHPVLNRF